MVNSQYQLVTEGRKIKHLVGVADDKIIVVGSGDDLNGALEFVVARFNADGSFANTANSFGKVTTSFSAGDDVGSGIAVQSDNKIVVVGTSDDGSGTSEFAVARYLPDLSFSFNGGGGRWRQWRRLLHSNCGLWFANATVSLGIA